VLGVVEVKLEDHSVDPCEPHHYLEISRQRSPMTGRRRSLATHAANSADVNHGFSNPGRGVVASTRTRCVVADDAG
jgi:hypothetical protein